MKEFYGIMISVPTPPQKVVNGSVRNARGRHCRRKGFNESPSGVSLQNYIFVFVLVWTPLSKPTTFRNVAQDALLYYLHTTLEHIWYMLRDIYT